MSVYLALRAPGPRPDGTRWPAAAYRAQKTVARATRPARKLLLRDSRR